MIQFKLAGNILVGVVAIVNPGEKKENYDMVKK